MTIDEAARGQDRRGAGPTERQRIGLVLGAGGASGAAFHAGTLLALQHDTGWDPASADVIVGSSAGSIVGGLLRAGVTTDDLAAWGVAVDALPAGQATRRLLDEIRDARRRVRPSVPRLTRLSAVTLRSLLRPSLVHPRTLLLSLLPHGWIDAAGDLERLGSLLDGWPEEDLWVTAVRAADGRRVVFGRDDTSVPPGTAIAASCAIPALYRPVTIDGRRYVDGGVHSPTNADLLVGSEVDAAVVLSPMSARASVATRRPDRLSRGMFRRRLDSECEQLTRSGVTVHVIEPDADTLHAMGVNALDTARTPRVVTGSFFAAGARLATDGGLRDLLTSSGRRVPATA